MSNGSDAQTKHESDESILAAATAIAAADYLLVAAGAGFSADSGLPIYADVARDPKWRSLGLSYQVRRAYPPRASHRP